MSIRRRPVIRGLIALAVVLNVATLIVGLLRGGAEGSSLALDLLFEVVPISFCVVGALLVVRRPENAVGSLCLAIGLLWSVEAAGYTAADFAAADGRLDVANWLGLFGFLWLPALGLMGTHLALRLPTGTLLTPRWRWLSRMATAVIALIFVVVVTAPGPVADVKGTHNPLASAAGQTAGVVFLLLPIVVIGAITSLVVRYRRAVGVERLQLRWIALGGIALLTAVIVALVPDTLGLVKPGSAPALVEGLSYVAFAAVPSAIGIAVLRYRLYDIDTVINRALVYGGLTATLAATYVGAVLLLQLVLSGVTSGNGLAVAGSTLAVAALFQPARGRIQAAVDHRFFRRKYDAVRTLEQFATHLRDQVDLDALAAELRAVVGDTMQPAHVSLWVRPR
jgi:hypothetical protein